MSGFDLSNIPAELFGALLENPHESLILIDKQGVIRFLSPTSAEFYEVPREAAVGKHILEMNPESRLPKILETGRAEVGRVLRMGDRERIVARIPLKNHRGEVVGAMAKLVFWNPGEAKQVVRQLEVLESRLDYYQKELRNLYSGRYSLDRLIGESRPMKAAKDLAARAAASDLAVLITGETGTGKEVLAHAIHQMSSRKNGPFVRVNCAAIPGELFEAELFGYEAGAFTGAGRKGKPGKFELADGGTIFLDEVGDLPLSLQVKLLRVIQEREVERLGGTKVLEVDFRLIAATNRDLRSMVETRAFREDLFYRLNIFHLQTPPLREMPEDVPRLAYHILSTIRAGNPRAPSRISSAAMERLTTYHWPGNVRQMQNALERAAALAAGNTLDEAHLPEDIFIAKTEAKEVTGHHQRPLPLKEELAKAESLALKRALRFTGGNRAEAARVLGIHRSGLYQKLRRHGLEEPDV